tara:strand:+ start:200 stop:583 length:384 start_codon:yes stop_codon:yes gene_type:complete
MNNTDKLLRAFIEASGYEIEEVVTILDGQTVTEKGVTYGNQTVTSIDYKVTKKSSVKGDNITGRLVDMIYDVRSLGVEPKLIRLSKRVHDQLKYENAVHTGSTVGDNSRFLGIKVEVSLYGDIISIQ